MRVILVGFMGCGKSSLGKKIATRTDLPFIDSDKEIEDQNGLSVSELFVKHGESHFREMESRFIHSLFQQDSFVLATGGGMPCYGNNMQALNQLGTTIYLKRPAAELAKRLLQAKSQRPLIQSLSEDELLEYIEKTLAEREAYYSQAQLILEREEQQLPFILDMLGHLHPPRKN